VSPFQFNLSGFCIVRLQCYGPSDHPHDNNLNDTSDRETSQDISVVVVRAPPPKKRSQHNGCVKDKIQNTVCVLSNCVKESATRTPFSCVQSSEGVESSHSTIHNMCAAGYHITQSTRRPRHQNVSCADYRRCINNRTSRLWSQVHFSFLRPFDQKNKKKPRWHNGQQTAVFSMRGEMAERGARLPWS
jgi:hypothetical protein